MQHHRKPRKWLASIILVLTVIGVGGMSYVLANSVTIYAVESGSMEPTLPFGSRVLVQQQEQYETGDIITFYADDGEVVTHRLVEQREDGLVTMGDANDRPDAWDDPVTGSDVIGRVTGVTSVFTTGFWLSLRGFVIIGCVVIAGFLAWLLIQAESKKDSEMPKGV